MKVFDRIKYIANLKGVNLKDLAVKAGLSENAIYSWKKKTPRMDSLKAVASILNVSVDYLLGNSDSTEETHNKPIVDLNKDDSILTFDGTPISDEDKELIRRLLRGK